MEDTSINPEKFIAAVLAPFGGKDTHTKSGELKPSTSGKSWTFTLFNRSTSTHLTFKSYRPKGWKIDSPVLISIMVGTDNNSDFGYVGSISKEGFYKPSEKSKVAKGHQVKADRALVWLLTKLRAGVELPAAVEIKGSTGCCRCGRKLTNPDSINDGLGPVCRKKANQSLVHK